MEFKSKKDLLLKIKFLKEIGRGSQGICCLDKNNSLVYKIFYQFLDNSVIEKYSYSEIMQFSNIKNNTYVFPKDVLTVDNDIVGYIENYVSSKELTSVNPIKVSLDKLINCINKVYSDIETISENGVLTYDVMYNILYKDKFNIIDSDEYVIRDNDPSYLFDLNKERFNYAIYNFLVDNYFDEFIRNYKILNNMYKYKEADVTVFIELLRKNLSEYIGFEVNKLGDAKECINKVKVIYPNYIRDIKL